MVASREYGGYKTIKETTQDFRRLFELWGVEKSRCGHPPVRRARSEGRDL